MNCIQRWVFNWLKAQLRSKILSEAEKRALVAYLRLLNGLRRGIGVLLLAVFAFQFMVFSFFGALITGFYLWSADWSEKLPVLFVAFTALFLVPLVLILYFLSEGFWYRASGADAMVRKFQSKID